MAVTRVKKPSIVNDRRFSCDALKGGLFEVLRTAFGALALGAFRYILQFSAFKQGFHDYLAATAAKEFVCGDCGSRVLTCSTHE